MIAFLFIIISFQGAQFIEMKSGTDTFVEKNSKLYQDYDHLYLGLFSTESIVILIEGDDVTKPEVLQAMDRIDKTASNIPGVMEVTSPSRIIKDNNYQSTGKWTIPNEEGAVDELISQGMPEYLMPDDKHAFISVVFGGTVSETTREEILRETEISIPYAEFPPGYNIIVTGDVAFDIAMNEEMNTSMGTLLMLSVLLMIVVLYLVFRHVRWRLLPLPIVLLGIIYTFGAMGYLDIPMTMVSMSAFPVLIGLGIDYAIQFHNRIEEEFERNHSASYAVIETVKHTGPAVLIALGITGLGFVSLFTSSVPMIQDFGKLLLIGIIMCFMSSLFVGVSVIYGLHGLSNNSIVKKLSFRKKERKKKNNRSGAGGPDMMERLIEKSTVTAMHHPFIILAIAGSLCLGGLYFDAQVPIQTDVTTFVPQDMEALIDLKHFGDILGGDEEINIIIKTDNNADPELLEWVDEFSDHEVESRGHIYGSSSIVDVIKSMNDGVIPQDTGEIEQLYSEIPENQRDRYLHGNNMLILNLNIGNAMLEIGLEGIQDLTSIVEEDVVWMPPPPGTTVTMTGNSVVFFTVISALTSGRLMMTLLGLVLVFAGLLVIYRDLLKAFTPVITMFMVIGWSGGLMYLMGMEYTPMTATLGALILGVGSEYAVLMMERYFEERDKGAEPEAAMRESSVKIGKAIVTSGLTTVFGFSALIASPFSLTSNFGIITVMDVILALMASFIVFPAVIVLLDKHRMKKKAKKLRKNKSSYNSTHELSKKPKEVTF
ncbi:hydrophobe/amphiphile efflux-3 (HAE3) family transporter [Methanolobus sp. ZRKC2]|uniref:hydrophobe/amphiphile efflux-3 (HAE3) family transporter n=1 Tax=Methanolobus sp. ZRKC2 TaxID=3125783 RepID=UPI003872DE74